MTKFVTLQWPEDHWEPIGYNRTGEDLYERLSGPRLLLNGAGIHVMAHRVRYVNGVQEAGHPSMEKDLAALQTIYEGCYETLQLFGHEYVLVCYPFST